MEDTGYTEVNLGIKPKTAQSAKPPAAGKLQIHPVNEEKKPEKKVVKKRDAKKKKADARKQS